MADQKVFHDKKHLPQIIAFDLDFTLWPYWVDTHVDPPFKRLHDGSIVDRSGMMVNLYPDVLKILEATRSKGILMVVASRTTAIEVAESLLEIMDLNEYFTVKQIYPGSKVAHFSCFHDKLGVPYDKMLFFDDEERNIRDLTRQGVTSVHVPNGLSWQIFHEGLQVFADKSRPSQQISNKRS